MNQKKIITTLAIAGVVAGAGAHHIQAQNVNRAQSNTQVKYVVTQSHQVESSNSVINLAAQNVIGTVTNLQGAKTANVRKQGGMNSPVIMKLKAGTKVKVLAEDGGWYKIEYNGTTGWIYSNLLSVNGKVPGQSTVKQSAKFKGKVGTVVNLGSNESLNVRSNGTTNAPIVTTLPEGTHVKVLNENGGWYQIEYNGVTGWVYSSYLQVGAASSSNTTSNSTSSSKPSSSTSNSTSSSKPSSSTSNSTSSSKPSSTTNSTQKYVKVNSPIGLWLLQSPSMQGNKIEAMPNNAVLKVLGTSSNGNWTKVEYNGVVGWCYSEYTSAVSTSNSTSSNTTNSTSSTSTIKVNSPVGLWLLQSPSMQGQKIEVMPNGASLKVLGTSSNGLWTKVEYNGVTGWCYTQYTSAATNNSTSSNTTNSTSSTSSQTSASVTSPIGLWLLQSPSMQGQKIEVMPNGASLKVLGTSANGSWIKVQYNGITGWCYKEYTTMNNSNSSSNSTSSSSSSSTNNSGSSTSQTTTTSIGTVVNVPSGYYLHLRTQPNTQSKIIKSLTEGSHVIILGQSNGWYKVDINGTIGYVSGAYLTQTTGITTGVVANLGGAPYLHMRAGGDPYTAIIKDLPAGTRVNILSNNGGWYNIEYDGLIGYVYSAYINTGAAASNPSGSVQSANGVVTVMSPVGLYMNNGPAAGTGIITAIPYMTNVKVSAVQNGWYKVSYNGMTGWIDGAYVTAGIANQGSSLN